MTEKAVPMEQEDVVDEVIEQRHNRLKYFYEFGATVLLLALMIAGYMWFESVMKPEPPHQAILPTTAPTRFPTYPPISVVPTINGSVSARIALQHTQGEKLLLNESFALATMGHLNMNSKLTTLLHDLAETESGIYIWSDQFDPLMRYVPENQTLTTIDLPGVDWKVMHLAEIDAGHVYTLLESDYLDHAAYELDTETLVWIKLEAIPQCTLVYCIGPRLVDIIDGIYILRNSGGDGCGGWGEFMTYDPETEKFESVTEYGVGCVTDPHTLVGYDNGLLYLADGEYSWEEESGASYSRLWSLNLLTTEVVELVSEEGMPTGTGYLRYVEGDILWQPYEQMNRGSNDSQMMLDRDRFVAYDPPVETDSNDDSDQLKNEALVEDLKAMFGTGLVVEYRVD